MISILVVSACLWDRLSRDYICKYPFETKSNIKTFVSLTDMLDMRGLVSRFHTKAFFISAIVALIMGCQPKDLTFEVSGSDSISGSVLNFSSISSLSNEPSTQATCVGQLVTLYSLDSQGKKGTKLLENSVDRSGNFSFIGVRSLGIDVAKDSGVTKYVIEFSCGSSTYQRFVTGTSDQKLSDGTTLMAWVSQTDVSASVRTQSAQSWAEFYQTLESAGSVTAAFSALNSNTALKAKFQTLFGVDPVVLNDAVPKVTAAIVPSSFNEEVGQAMSVQTTHWSSTYNIAYAWKIGSTTLSNSSNFTYTPSANSQGSHTIQLFIGQNNGSNGVDTSKPYTQETFPVTIQNSVTPTVPSTSRVSAQYTTSLSATVRITTGSVIDSRPQNCKSFSNLALVEESYPAIGIAPLLSSSYNIDCTAANQQDVNVILSGTEGVRVVRMWARDAAGNISSTSQDVSITLDRISPSLTLMSLDGGQTIRGGGVTAITWSATESNPATNPVSLDYSTNSGSTWTSIASSVANSGTYNWNVPSVNSSNVKVRITMSDLAGNSGTVQSANTFTIDSTAPTAPVTTRTSGQYSNSTTVDLTVTCDSDYSGIFISNSSTAPLSTDSGWTVCTAAMQFTVASGDGTKMIYAYSKDSVGNVSSSSSVTMVLDQTVPTVSITTTLAGSYKGGASLSLQFSVTEFNITTAQSFNVSYSADNGSTWATAGAVASTNGPLSSQSFTYPLTFPSVDTSQFKLRVTAMDRAGNSVNSNATAAVTVDSTAPTISSFSLAAGSASVALPGVSIQVTSNDALSGPYQMRLSESATFADDSWRTYSSTGSTFSLSMISGVKNVYLWVKDAVGNVSSSSSTSITLDIGNPPIVTVTSPTSSSGPYSTGNTVNIEWSCSSVNGLDTNPVQIKYTTDDGLTFNTVSSWIPNNLTSTTGNYAWTFPSSVSTFRLLIECKSLAGVVASAYSSPLNTSGWSIFAGDPANMSENVSASLALMIKGSAGFQTLAVDSAGNIFFSKNSTIMKVDSMTGLVTRFAGDPQGGGTCNIQAGSDPRDSTFNKIGSSQTIFGMNAAKDSVIFGTCNKVWIMNTSTRALAVLNSAGAFNGYPWFLSKSGSLFYSNAGYVYKLNLNSLNQSPVAIMGNGSCAPTVSTVGTDALLSTVPGPNGGGCSGETYLFTNSDDSKLWIGCWDGVTGCQGSARMDWNAAQSKYTVASTNVGWGMADWDLGWCSTSYISNRVWCSSRYSTGNRSYFDTQTEVWTKTSMGKTVFIRYAASPAGMVSLSSDNLLTSVTENSNGTISSGTIGGSDIESYGNGSNFSKMAFSAIEDITYSQTLNRLFVDTSVKLRQIDFSSTLSSTLVYSGYLNRITMNRAGTQMSVIFNCSGKLYQQNSFNGSTFTAGSDLMNRNPCGTSTYDATYPLADNVPVSTRVNWQVDDNRRPLHHSNGKFYFFTADSSGNNALIYSSNSSVLRVIAGTTGANGYNASHSGQSANTASLTNVRTILEVPSGRANAGDLVIVDANRLRLITLVTESGNPKIYDLVAFSLATGYGANSSNTFSDAVYDFNSEILDGSSNPILGTGAFYYVTNSNAVRKFIVTAVSSNIPTTATDTGYNFTGTTLTGNIRISLTPQGLLVTQPNKNRILRVTP